MANTKISQLTANTNPSGSEELVYALNNANGKMTLNTMKTFVQNNLSGYVTTSDLTTGLATKQDTLVSATNIRTINGSSILGSGDLIISGGAAYSAGTGIDVTSGTISNTGVTSVNGQTGAVTVTGGGAGGYDCIVAADGTGDYTTIGAAIAAGNFNIFVKNGNYTESAQRDPYTNGSNMLHIVGESYLGVNITVSSTITTTGNTGYFIDMRVPTGYTEFDFYLKNLNFNITLKAGGANDVDYFFRTGNNTGKFLVEDCGFNYTGNGGTLFSGSNIFDINNDGFGYANTRCNMFNRCVFETSSPASDGFNYIVSSGDIVAENCVFKTSSTGVMSLVGSASGYGYLKHCNIDVYGLYFNDNINLLYTKVKIASGGSFYQHNTSNPYDFEPDYIEGCSFIIAGDLGNAGGLSFGGICKDTDINVSATNLTRLYIGGGLWNNIRYCSGVRLSYSGNVTLYSNTYGLILTTTALTINTSGLNVSGIRMGNGGTVSITGSYSAIIGNYWGGATVTDTGSDNVVANNVA